ncbi:FAD-binding protein (plasmid) [Sphingomonas paeninsulae]|uniref:FAD-binding protein n=1 Tax=Sphingomonas paeninsulae TaxID=2319844 RepID=A0A494T8C6_SPHPE|nr:FAD-binding protein [Sphingomonas paeninsulae]
MEVIRVSAVTDRESEPLVLQDADSGVWDDIADVIVVGFGGAGACAAIEARESSADVIAIDRFAGGGATAYSGGIIYAGGTSFQKQAGFSDTAEVMYDYLAMEVGNVIQPETLRRYCNESAANLDWLIRHGVPYAADPYLEKTIYPPDGKFLYYSGNEKVPEYAARAKPAPRGHRPVGTGMTGHVYYAALARAAAAIGVRLRQHEKVVRLVQDSTGRIIGVQTARVPDGKRAAHKRLYDKVVPMLPFKAKVSERAIREARALELAVSETRLIRARKGVILSTGGFAFNLDMLGEHRPFFARNYRALMRLGSMGCDGSGIMLGQSAGGATDRMDSVYAARNIAPPAALLDGILVNARGERFINEETYSGYLGLAIADQPDGGAWLILPSRSYREAIRQALFGGWLFFKFYGVPALLNFLLGGTRSSSSIERLAAKLAIDPVVLRRTIDIADADLAAGAADRLGKSTEHRARLGGRRLHAINMAIPNIYAFTYLFTLGGLKVDENSGNVIRGDGSRVDGLYAAGRAAVGLCSNGYLSGMSIGDGMFSGRRAGRAAAVDAPTETKRRVTA